MRFMTEFHRNEKLAKDINNTFITLSPKIESPQRIANFKSISMVGSMYKVLSNVLYNRLRKLIGSVISYSQSSFIQGIQILYGILIEIKVLDDAQRLKKRVIIIINQS